jgi:hypothetical protein
VLLDHAWKGGSGRLAQVSMDARFRRSFPVRRAFADAVEARHGAFEVIGKTKIKHTKLNDAIRVPPTNRPRRRAAGACRPARRCPQDWGAAQGYRRIELIAKGRCQSSSWPRARDGVVVLKVTPAIAETGVDQSMERFLREFNPARNPASQHRAHLRSRRHRRSLFDGALCARRFAQTHVESSRRKSLAYARDLAYALQAIHRSAFFIAT